MFCPLCPEPFLTGEVDNWTIWRIFPPERILKTLRRSSRRLFLLSCFAAILFLAPSPASAASGKIWGRVLDARNRPLPKAFVSLLPGTGGSGSETISDKNGYFGFMSIAPGLYSARAWKDGAGAAEKRGLMVTDASDIDIEFVLAPDARGALESAAAKAVDFSAVGAQTTITADQIDLLPSGNSLGSLLENQDLSATTNRIDVGGLWATMPFVYGARGGVSWTQNVVLLNGMDVSDPYEGGRALWLPDVFSLASIGHDNAILPVQATTPGGQLSLTPRAGTAEFHAAFRAFYTDKSLSADNITPALQSENLFETNTFSRASEYDFQLSGPLSSRGATFFTAWSERSIGRNAAGFSPEDRSSLLSGLFTAAIPAAGNVLKFVWVGQSAAYDSYGSDRDVAWEATSRRKVLSGILQAIYETRPEGLHHSRLGLSWAVSKTTDGLQAEAGGQPWLDIFTRAAGRAPASLQDGLRQKLVLSYEGASLFPGLGDTDHRVEYGAQIRSSSASLTTTVPRNTVLRYYGPRAAEVAVSSGPFDSRLSSLEANVFLQDAITLSGLITLRIGLNASVLSAGNRTASVHWMSVSPRAELTIPLSLRKTSTFKIALARYDLQLPLNTLLWGDPGAPGALVYAWTDPNGDGLYQESERGALLRREGPAYSSIDPDLLRPRLDEFALTFVQNFDKGWRFTLSGFLRRTNRLLETINTGVTAGDYSSLTISDFGDNRIPGDADDLTFTVFDRRTSALGQDFFVLTNPDLQTRTSTYRGLDLTLIKAWDERFLFYLSMTAMEIVGTTDPGNTELENDDGMIGSLYDDPNAAINARGRMRFDRAYTIRLGFSAPLPFGTRIGLVAKYYDGQPFARKIIVEGLSQGLLYVQAHPRGVARYEFNMTVDLRLEKSVIVGRNGVLRFLVDAFNLFNQSLATEENEWTSPSFPLRFASEIQSPRVIRAGIQFSF
ncbi:MAG: carboxypeptidase-like regulatory domain-containing protein [Candidatus Aminicenantes bacterium]|nr:carboxypeptidase-like regulatory domain-containing protein [Candidatus Aminicenantes bacterium]